MAGLIAGIAIGNCQAQPIYLHDVDIVSQTSDSLALFRIVRGNVNDINGSCHPYHFL